MQDERDQGMCLLIMLDATLRFGRARNVCRFEVAPAESEKSVNAVVSVFVKIINRGD